MFANVITLPGFFFILLFFFTINYKSRRFIDVMYETPHLSDVVHFPFHKGELLPRGVPLRQLIYRLYCSNFRRNLCHSCGIVRGLFAYIVPSGKARKNEIGGREIRRRRRSINCSFTRNYYFPKHLRPFFLS